MSNELIAIEEKNALQVFSTENGLDPIIQQAKDLVNDFEHDLSTQAGRNRTKSLARKVASLKTRLDGMGKDLVSDWKIKAKAVDANRKAMRDELDALKIIARKPLTEWEEDQVRIESEEKARIEAEKIAAEIEQAHEVALLMNEKFDRELAEKLAKEEAERIEAARIAEEKRIAHEEELKQQAAEHARLDAERKAKEEQERIEREKQEAIKREEEAKLRAEQAERDRIAAEERAKAQAEEAERQRVLAEERAKQEAIEAAERAKQAEIQRQIDEENARKAEQERLEANKKHAAKIHNEMKQAFINYGLNEDQAVIAVKALVTKSIPHIGSVQY